MRTFNAFAHRIHLVLASWHSWAGAGVHDGPLALTRPINVAEAVSHGTNVTSLLIQAKAIRDDAAYSEWAALPENADQAADLADLIGEMEIAEKEFAEMTHHEHVWSTLHPTEKRRLAHSAIFDAEERKHLNARVQLKKIGQPHFLKAAQPK